MPHVGNGPVTGVGGGHVLGMAQGLPGVGNSPFTVRWPSDSQVGPVKQHVRKRRPNDSHILEVA